MEYKSNTGFVTYQSFKLTGKPYCWPAGSIATLTVLIYLITAASMFATWVAVKITIEMMAHKAIVRPEDTETNAASTNFSYKLTPLPSVVILCARVSLISPMGACQYGFMRHLANLLFSELCVVILHANKIVGSAKFVKKAVDFECSKVAEFFTRPTKLAMYQSKRCAYVGSCIENKCDRLKQNETAPELSRSAKYSGYSGCMNSCEGFSVDASCRYLAAVSDQTFELTQCPCWTTIVKLDIEITIANQTEKVERSFIPYMANNSDNLNVTVISIQRTMHYLENKRFTSKDKEYMLPPNFQLPAACSTEYKHCRNSLLVPAGFSAAVKVRLTAASVQTTFHKICENP
ncbi:hypothetical protein COOONC_00820 [Cooperia oncophora]